MATTNIPEVRWIREALPRFPDRTLPVAVAAEGALILIEEELAGSYEHASREQASAIAFTTSRYMVRVHAERHPEDADYDITHDLALYFDAVGLRLEGGQ